MPAPRSTAVLTKHRLPWTYLGVGAAACCAYVLVPALHHDAALMIGLGLYGVVGMIAGIRLHRPKAPRAWWWFAAGLLLFWGRGVDRYGQSALTGHPVGFPSFGDVVSLAAYPCVIAGLLLLVRRRTRPVDGAGLIDSLIITLGLALVAGVLLIDPYMHLARLGLATKLVSISFPAGDIFLLAAAVRLAIDSGKRRPAFYLVIAAILVRLATDFSYGLLTLHGAHHHQLWADTGWIAFYLLWGTAALHPSIREISEPASGSQSRLTSLRLVLLAGATVVAPVLEVVKVIEHHEWDPLVVIGASIILSGLVFRRMAWLVRRGEQSAARERALTAAGGLLVAATAPEEIVIAALQAFTDFGQEPIDARLCRIAGDEVRVTAIDDRGALVSWTVSADVGTLVARREPGGLSALSPDARRQLRVPAGDAKILKLELLRGAPDQPVLTLVAAGRSALSNETRNALRTLGQQVALALGSAELSEEVHRQASEARFASLVQNSSDLITVLDAENRILYQSPSIERVLGYSAEAVTGRSFGELLHPDEQGRLLRRLTDGAGAGSRSEVIECMLQHRDGSLRHFEILHADLLSDSAVGGVVLNGRDVSERKAFEQQLAHQAFHDPITHLANRALFNERVRHAVARTLRDGQGMAVLLVDLDDFKTVNDSLGHAQGDRVLREVAQRIASSIRAADTAARFGGDEFAVLLEGVSDLQSAVETAERILEALSRPLALENTDLTIRASLGISIAEGGSPSGADELIRNADAAMYIAKADGKGGYRIFEPAMHERVVARLELRADLERALAREEFELHYQPLIRLHDGAVTGVEALLRWRHPTRGLVAPMDFIPFAEESGLIVPIGRWVLREGCRQAKALREQAAGPVAPTIGVNLSVQQLFHSDIVADVAQALTDADLDPSALTLEITESMMMMDTDEAVTQLVKLRRLGVRLAMDDFGTGYSSLSYLSLFPLDVLKMDRSLLAAGASPVGLATAVLSLGETFGLEVVAEGIEFAEQAATLRQLGCETGQGFYFARPMDHDALVAYLADRAGAAAAPAVAPAGPVSER